VAPDSAETSPIGQCRTGQIMACGENQATTPMPRKVSGSSKSAAAAKAEVMPGTISNDMPASLKRRHFLSGTTENQRITGFQPDHALSLTRQA
jgi:hypothetical protein